MINKKTWNTLTVDSHVIALALLAVPHCYQLQHHPLKIWNILHHAEIYRSGSHSICLLKVVCVWVMVLLYTVLYSAMQSKHSNIKPFFYIACIVKVQ